MWIIIWSLRLSCELSYTRGRYVVFNMKWLFVLLSFSFWPLCILSFFDLRILISPLISSNIPFTVVSVRNIYAYEKHTSMHKINIHFTVASIKRIYTYRRHTSHLRINKKHQNTDSWGANCIIVSIADTTKPNIKTLVSFNSLRIFVNDLIFLYINFWLID